MSAAPGPLLLWLTVGIVLAVQWPQPPPGLAVTIFATVPALMLSLLIALRAALPWASRLALMSLAMAASVLGQLWQLQHADAAQRMQNALPEHGAVCVVELEIQRVYRRQFGQAALVQVQGVSCGPVRQGQRVWLRCSGTAALAVDDLWSCTGLLKQEQWSRGPMLVLRASQLHIKQSRAQRSHAWAWHCLDHLRCHKELAGALLLGRGRPPERPLFAEAGLLHVLAVSGMHVGLALAALMLVMRTCLVPYRARQYGLAVGAAAYVWLTAASLPTIRAAAMAWSLVLYRLTARRASRLAPLALAILLLACWEVEQLRSLSFMLSAAAVAGIVSLGCELMRWRRQCCPLRPWVFDPWWWRTALAVTRWSLDGLAVGLAAGLAVLPLTAMAFGQAQPGALFGSLVVTPPLTAALLSGLLLLLVSAGFGPTLPEGFYLIVEWSFMALVAAVSWVASWPGATCAVPAPSCLCVCLWPLGFLPLSGPFDLPARVGVFVGLLLLW